MATVNLIDIPEDMSCVNFMHAVWGNAPFASVVIEIGAAPLHSEFMTTAEKIYNLMLDEFVKNQKDNSIWLNDFNGKYMKFHLYLNSNKVDTVGYDNYYGTGSLQKSLVDYQNREPCKKIDPKEEYTFHKLLKDLDAKNPANWVMQLDPARINQITK